MHINGVMHGQNHLSRNPRIRTTLKTRSRRNAEKPVLSASAAKLPITCVDGGVKSHLVHLWDLRKRRNTSMTEIPMMIRSRMFQPSRSGGPQKAVALLRYLAFGEEY